MKLYLILGILLCVTASCKSQATAKLQEMDPIPFDPAVRYGKLENGFTYYLKDIEDPENVVQFSLVVKAGWDHEGDDQQEYAHLLEHLLAKETRSFPNLRHYFYENGRRRHAFTKMRNTDYFATIPRDDKQVFSDGLQVLLDWSQGNEWKSESIKVERGAVEGEMRTTDAYQNWKTGAMEREVLVPMGYIPVDPGKSLKSIKNFNSEAFYRFYEDWYRPDLQAAIIVGDINVDSLEKVVKEKFGTLKGPFNPPNAEQYLNAQSVHFDSKVHFATVVDSLESDIKLEILRVRPNLEYDPKSRADFRRMLLQKLYMVVLDERSQYVSQQYTSPFSYFWANYRSNNMGSGLVNATQMSVDLKGDNTEIKNQFQRAVKAWRQLHLGINKSELKRAKAEILKLYGFDQPETVTKTSVELIDHFVRGKAAPSPEEEEKLIKNLLDGIKTADLQKFAQEKGSLNSNTYFIFFKDKKTSMPEYEVLEQWKKEVETIQIEPIEAPAPTLESLEDVAHIPISLVPEEVNVTENIIGISTVVLRNGVKLLLKPTKPKLDLYKNRISIHAIRPNLIPWDNPKSYLAAQVAPEVMLFTGAGLYSKFDLERFSRKKRINFRLQIDKDNQVISGESNVKDLAELLNLTYLYLSRPRKDEEAFEAWKEVKKNELEGKNIRGSADFVMDKIEPVWYPQLPNLDEKDLQGLTQEDVFNAVKKWFSSIEGYTFIVTGDFDPEEVLPILVQRLSGFPTRDGVPMTTTKKFNFPLKKMQEKLECKNIDAAYVRLFFPVKVEDNLKTKIELKLLSRALNERIHNRLRIGSYAPVSQGLWMDEENNIFSFNIVFDSALGEEDKMISWALEEFQNLKEQGVDKEWLEMTLHEELITYESGLSTLNYNDFWKYYLESKIENREDLEKEVLQYGTILKHFVDIQDINRAAKKILNEENYQQFVIIPEGTQNVNKSDIR